MGKKRTSQVSDDRIIDTYLRTQSAAKTAAELSIGQTTVYRLLAKNDILATGLGHYRANAAKHGSAEAAEIRRRYEGGELIKSLVADFGSTYSSIKAAIRRAGGRLRPNSAPTTKPGEIDRIRTMYKSGASQQRISLALGRSQSFVTRAMARSGIKARARAAKEQHGQWKGGRWRKGDGYWCVKVADNDALAASMQNRNGYVLEHRLVMARSLGRALLATETVHHIDGDRSNNALGNLQLRQGKHGKGAAMRCRDCGSHNIEHAPLGDPLSGE
jgi:DNA invertase Pin-like site-specific DNA recombinase